MPANLHPDVRNVMPPLEFSRRELVVTALASGFALAVQAVNAHSVISIDQMHGAFENSKLKNEPVVFPDAQHGFNADYRASYNAEDAKAAWSQMLGWFRQFGAV